MSKVEGGGEKGIRRDRSIMRRRMVRGRTKKIQRKGGGKYIEEVEEKNTNERTRPTIIQIIREGPHTHTHTRA